MALQQEMVRPQQMSHRQILVVLYGLMLGMLLAALDQTIVGTALPRITADLGGQNHYAWVVTAYLLTSTASTPLYGKISDLYGRKRIFQAAIVIFLVGSALAGASQNMAQLIATRALQGLGAGGLITLALAIIGDVISPRERGRYQGYFGAVFGLSSVAGPLLGGFFTQHLTWRWVFYINLPLGILALIVTSAVLNIPFQRREHRIDYSGAALMVVGVSAILLALSWGGKEYAWGSPVIALLFVGGALLLVAFAVREHYAPEPILPLRLFRNRVFSVTNAIAFVVGFAMFGAVIFLPLYLQIVKGVSPTTSGLQLLPLMLGVITASVTSGRLITRLGRYKVFPVTGLALMSVGMWLLSRIGAHTGFGWIALGMVVLGVGLGCVMQVLIIAVQNAVPYSDLGVATSSNTFFRSMGGAMGVAVFGAILTNALSSFLIAHTPPGATRHTLLDALTNGNTGSAPASAGAHGLFIDAYVHGIQAVFMWAVPIAVLGFLLSWLLPEIHLSTASGLGRGHAETAETSGESDPSAIMQ
jgi:EmrB/QacA subfamily drug resistance transporter